VSSKSISPQTEVVADQVFLLQSTSFKTFKGWWDLKDIVETLRQWLMDISWLMCYPNQSWHLKPMRKMTAMESEYLFFLSGRWGLPKIIYSDP